MDIPDPLTSLRKYLMENEPPPMNEDFYVFDNYRFHKTVPTAFLSSSRQPYSLESLHFVVTHKDTMHSKYLIACSKAKVPFVTLADKKAVIAYMGGEIDTCANISPEAPPIDSTLIECIKPTTSEEQPSKRLKLDVEDLELDETLQKEKEEIANRLDGPRVKSVVIDDENVTGMTKDQLENLKLKFLKRKLATIPTTIKKVEKTSGFMQADAVVTRRIMDRERSLSTRTTVLNANNKKHFTDIISAIQRSHKVEAGKSQAKPVVYDRYNVQEDNNWWKDKLKANDIDDFQIDTRGTFAAGNSGLSVATKTGENATNHKNPPAPHKSINLTSHQSHGTKPAKTKEIPIIIVPSAVTSLISLYNIKDFIENGKYHNMKFKFFPTLEKKNAGAQKSTTVDVDKNSMHFEVIDNTNKLTSHDWKRVVAVFVTGQAWQFKDWHWPSPVELFSHGIVLHKTISQRLKCGRIWCVIPIKVFHVTHNENEPGFDIREFFSTAAFLHLLKGFYLKYGDTTTPPEVKSWNVETLEVMIVGCEFRKRCPKKQVYFEIHPASRLSPPKL